MNMNNPIIKMIANANTLADMTNVVLEASNDILNMRSGKTPIVLAYRQIEGWVGAVIDKFHELAKAGKHREAYVLTIALRGLHNVLTEMVSATMPMGENESLQNYMEKILLRNRLGFMLAAKINGHHHAANSLPPIEEQLPYVLEAKRKGRLNANVYIEQPHYQPGMQTLLGKICHGLDPINIPEHSYDVDIKQAWWMGTDEEPLFLLIVENEDEEYVPVLLMDNATPELAIVAQYIINNAPPGLFGWHISTDTYRDGLKNWDAFSVALPHQAQMLFDDLVKLVETSKEGASNG